MALLLGLVRKAAIGNDKQGLLFKVADTKTQMSSGGRMNSPQLSAADSPLATIFLSDYISRLTQETVRYRALPYKKLAQQTSIPSPTLEEAIKGRLGLTRGRWKMLFQLLELPTTFQIRLSERNEQPCWEAYFPPVSVQAEGSTGEDRTGRDNLEASVRRGRASPPSNNSGTMDANVSVKIRKWRLAGELRGELNRSQTEELLRALAQPSPDWSFLSPSQRNAVRVLVAYNSPDVLAQYFQRVSRNGNSSARPSDQLPVCAGED